jgi:hypothetical protein
MGLVTDHDESVNDFSLRRVLMGVWLGFPLVVMAAAAVQMLPLSKAIKPATAQASDQRGSQAPTATVVATP